MTASAEAARPGVVRVRLDLGYDGARFHGWAAQRGLRTVQDTVETAIALVLGEQRERVSLTVAGRTDAGVHARGQVCHADLDLGDASPEQLARRLRGVLPEDVSLCAARTVDSGFDARFSALSRRYAYRVSDPPAALDTLRRHDVLRWPRPLDEARMNSAAAALIGEHDFAAFCKWREGATSVRLLRELCWIRTGDVLSCRVVANAFCHNMVRSLVGCLLVVGDGRRTPSWVAEVLARRERDPRVPVVPALGLTLEEVRYPSAATEVPASVHAAAS